MSWPNHPNQHALASKGIPTARAKMDRFRDETSKKEIKSLLDEMSSGYVTVQEGRTTDYYFNYDPDVFRESNLESVVSSGNRIMIRINDPYMADGLKEYTSFDVNVRHEPSHSHIEKTFNNRENLIKFLYQALGFKEEVL